MSGTLFLCADTGTKGDYMDYQEKVMRRTYLENLFQYKYAQFNTDLKKIEEYEDSQDPDNLEPANALLKEMLELNEAALQYYDEWKQLVAETTPDPLP